MQKVVQHIREWYLTLGLWPRIACILSVSLITLFLAFAYLGEQAIKEGYDTLFEERLAITQLVSDQIDRLLADSLNELVQATELIDVESELIDQQPDYLNQIFGRVSKFQTGLLLLSQDGEVLDTQPNGVYQPGFSLKNEPFIQAVLESKVYSISEPFLHPTNGRPVTAVTVPLLNEQEKIEGMLTGLITLDGDGIISPLHQAAILGQTEHAVLVDKQGRALVSTFGLPFLSPGEHQAFYIEAMKTGMPVVEIVPFELDLPGEPEGHLHVMAFVPLSYAPWGLAVGGDVVGDTFAGVQQLRRGLILMGTISLAGVWIITLYGTRRLVKPVQTLTKIANEIAEGNLSSPLQTGDGGEIGEMALALEHMRKQLLSNIEELAGANANLESQVKIQTAYLEQQYQLTEELLQKVITAQESERRRIAFELHDGLGQMLTAVEMSLQRVAKAVNNSDEEVIKRLKRSRSLTEKTIHDLRQIISALRPTVLDQLGLVAALEWVSNTILRENDVEVNLSTHGIENRLPENIETILFRIAQEAINNALKHSKATKISMTLFLNEDIITFIIEDNGVGIHSNQRPTDDAAKTAAGLGLAGMKERAALVGGELFVESEEGKGTKIITKVPHQ